MILDQLTIFVKPCPTTPVTGWLQVGFHNCSQNIASRFQQDIPCKSTASNVRAKALPKQNLPHRFVMSFTPRACLDRAQFVTSALQLRGLEMLAESQEELGSPMSCTLQRRGHRLSQGKLVCCMMLYDAIDKDRIR